MSAVEKSLLVTILKKLTANVVSGDWPTEKCRYCSGRSIGYSDNQCFDHDLDCVVNDVDMFVFHVRNDP